MALILSLSKDESLRGVAHEGARNAA